MIVNFRHGVVSGAKDGSSNPAFLQVAGANVGISATNTPVVFAIAHLDSNYLVTVEQSISAAWTNLPTTGTTYLYVDLDLTTATVTYGSTSFAPITQGARPSTADTREDQHWFDTLNKTMKVRRSGVWVEVARLFVADISGNAIHYQPFGSQINIIGEYLTGKVAFDNSGKPISKSSGEFFTTEDTFYVNGTISAPNGFGTQLQVVTAAEPIIPYAVVRYNTFNTVRLARYEDTDNTALGIAMAGAAAGERLSILPSGIVKNPNWNWMTVNKSIWIDSNGALVDVDPVLASSGRGNQPPVGRVIATDTIVFYPPLMGATVTDATMIGPMGPAGADGVQGPAGKDGTSVVLKGSVSTTGNLPPDAVQGDLYVVTADGHGYVWDGFTWADAGPIQGPKGDTGPMGPAGTSVAIKGSFTTLADLNQTIATPTVGDLYVVLQDGNGYTWDGTTWVNVGLMRGPAGPAGVQGPAGLAGPAGPAGAQGPMGPMGPAGQDGTSIVLKGSVATVAALPTTGNTSGDLYVVQADGNGYTWNGTAWISVGPIQGPAGPAGADGAPGPQGPQGAQGPIGLPGTPGATGPQGATGAQGLQGPIGPAGIQGAPGQSVSVKANGTALTTATTSINFTGTGVTTTNVGEAVTVTIDSGTGGGTATNLTNTPASTSVVINSSSGTGTTLAAATPTLAGVMTAVDKSKLDGLSNYTLPAPTATTLGGVKAGTNITIAADGTISSTASGGGGATNLTTTTAATSITIASDTGTDATIAAATTSVAGVMTAADKVKLDGLANYTLPVASTTVSGGVKVDGTTVTITNGVISAVGGGGGTATNITTTPAATNVAINSSSGTGATLAAATTSLAGVMTAADKAKLDGIAAGANNYTYTLPVATTTVLGGVKAGTNITIAADGTISSTAAGGGATNLTTTAAATNVIINSDTGTDATIAAATTSVAGVMTAADKSKLDGIAAGANNYTLPAPTATTLGGVKAGTNITIAADGTISSTASGGGGGVALTRSVAKTVTGAGGVVGTVRITAFGTQAEVDSITVVASGAGSVITVSNVPAGVLLSKLTLNYGSGFNTSTGITFYYPELYNGQTLDVTQYPFFYAFNPTNVILPIGSTTIGNIAGTVSVLRSGLTANNPAVMVINF